MQMVPIGISKPSILNAFLWFSKVSLIISWINLFVIEIEIFSDSHWEYRNWIKRNFMMDELLHWHKHFSVWQKPYLRQNCIVQCTMYNVKAIKKSQNAFWSICVWTNFWEKVTEIQMFCQLSAIQLVPIE